MKRIILFLVVLLSISAVQAQSFSVNADVAKWLLQTYNVGAEMTVGNRTTMGIEVFGNNKPYFHKDMKTYGVAPELRYYFSGRPMYHHFIGLSALAMTYDVDWKDRNHRGDAVGGGLTFGYVVPLSSRLTLDAHAGLGLVFIMRRRNLQMPTGPHCISPMAMMPSKPILIIRFCPPR